MEKSIHSREYAVLLELLRDTRVQAGLTQLEVASLLEETQTFVSKVERGERRLDLIELRRWCIAMRVDLQNFIGTFEVRLKSKATRLRKVAT